MGSYDKNEYIKREKINNVIYERPKSEGLAHALIMGNIACAIKKHIKEYGGYVSAGNYSLYLSEIGYVVPDIMLFNDKRLIKEKWFVGIPDYVTEILTSGTEQVDRGIKMKAYANCGIGEYWIIDLIRKKIEIFYLYNGEYVLNKMYTFEKQTYDKIFLRNAPMIKLPIEDIFWGI